MRELINKFYNGDCLEVMLELINKGIVVDMILCDMPYGSTVCHWDKRLPLDKLWDCYDAIAKQNAAIALTAQQPFATDLINSNRKNFRYEIIWEKSVKLNFMNANKMPLKGHENVLLFYKKLPTYNPQKYYIGQQSWAKVRKQREGRYEGYGAILTGQYTDTGWRHPHSVIKISNHNGGGYGGKVIKKETSIHPTQKPVELYKWFILTYTNEGDLIIDNCSGSGTLAIACIETNRNFICIEKDTEIFNKSVERYERYISTYKMLA